MAETTLTPLQELQALSWVEDAQELEPGNKYLVKTRANTLKVYLTKKIKERSEPSFWGWEPNYLGGALLKEKIPVYLPQYHITLTLGGSLDHHGDKPPFALNLASKPEKVTEIIGMCPQYHEVTKAEDWDKPFTPCFGYGSDPEINVAAEYRDVKTWKERAICAATYLQGAMPHGSEEYSWFMTSFAYRLGLVGDEVLEKPEQNN